MSVKSYLSDQSEGLSSFHLITLLDVNTPVHKLMNLSPGDVLAHLYYLFHLLKC